MKKEMLINVLQPEECRIAILENGVLEELYVERTSHESYVGNIYKGRIVNIEPSIQAAFVDFGVGRNGFLHVSDVEPAYYRHLEPHRDDSRRRPRQERVSRPGVVIPPARRPAPQHEAAEEIPTVDDLRDQAELPVEESGDMFVTPDLGLPSEVAVVNENIGAETDWLDEERTAAEAPSAPEQEEDQAPPQETEDFEATETTLSAWLEEREGRRPRVDSGDDTSDQEQSGDTAALLGAPESPSDRETSEPEVQHQSEEPEPEREKPRRGRGGRTRGGKRTRSTGRRSKSDSGDAGNKSRESGAGEKEQHEQRHDEEPPRPMGSADRRTSIDDEEPVRLGSGGGEDASYPESGDMGSNRTGRGSASSEDITDEELSFSLRRSEPAEEYLPRVMEQPLVEDTEPPETRDDYPDVDTGDESPGDILEAPIEPEDSYKRPPRDYDQDMPRGHRRGGRDRERGDRGDRDRDRRGGGRGRNGRRPMGGGRSMMGRPKPLIQDIFKKGQEVLVQVIKEGIGTKGPTLSTYISIAGRYLVLMPGLNRIGVSRKIQDEEQRRRLREILTDLKPPKGLGFIIRTAGLDRTKKELQRDLAYLARLWQVVVRRIRKLKSPAEIYQESDMITRTIRDTFTSEITSIIIDEPRAFDHAQEFMQIVMPRYANRIKCYSEAEPIFHKYGIENELNRIHQKTVPLPNGGSIVIEQTEALVAIDVNSGNFRADNNAEETAYQVNLLAAREIARQLRLRDLGGVVVNDFIDMREEKHRRGVERALRDAMRRDRARTKILRMSQFGIIEMTRQRIRPSLKRSVYANCPACAGAGQIKTVESMSIEVMRMLQLAAHRDIITQIQVRVHPSVSLYLLNRKRGEINDLEHRTNTQIIVDPADTPLPEFLQFVCYDNNGNEIPFAPQEPPRTRRRSYS